MRDRLNAEWQENTSPLKTAPAYLPLSEIAAYFGYTVVVRLSLCFVVS